MRLKFYRLILFYITNTLGLEKYVKYQRIINKSILFISLGIFLQNESWTPHPSRNIFNFSSDRKHKYSLNIKILQDMVRYKNRKCSDSFSYNSHLSKIVSAIILTFLVIQSYLKIFLLARLTERHFWVQYLPYP